MSPTTAKKTHPCGVGSGFLLKKELAREAEG